MPLALFDLDNTLLNGDSDHAWGIYLAEQGIVDAEEQTAKQDYFYEQYVAGSLDIYEFCEYQFQVLRENSLEQLQKWRADFLAEVIEPMIISGKPELVERHRDAGDTLVIITATNDFITAPIAKRLGVDHLIATKAQFNGQSYTGKVEGVPSFQQGKVERLEEWMAANCASLQDSVFYSDSYNDLPLLEAATTAVAVTPDDKLRAHAKAFHWAIID